MTRGPADETHRGIVLASRPVGAATEANFALIDGPIPVPAPGELLLETLYLSLDPYMRDLMNAVAYDTPVKVGEVMTGEGVAEVVASDVSSIPVGTLVRAWTGWQTHTAVTPEQVTVIPPDGVPPSAALGILGMTGLTAYSGLFEIGRPRAGETVVVAAAAGAVGSAVAQMATIAGARVVAIAGRSEKVEWLRSIGVDAALDHRTPTFADDLRAATPDGIDVYFESVGGHVWEAVQPLLNHGARVPVCGYVAHYDDDVQQVWVHDPEVLDGLTRRGIEVREFLETEFQESLGKQFVDDVSAWIAGGRLTYAESVVDGLDQAPAALLGLLQGANLGKQLVRVATVD